MENANPLRILFVEDLPTDAILAEREIRKSGLEFSSQRVDTKDAFLKALEEFRPDVIVSDYSMPEFDGMQALKLSLQRDARLPFILLTGSMNEETAVACMKAGASNYVIKEHIKRLPFAVKEALEQKKTRVAMDEADRALRESEERYRTLFESMDEGFCVVEMLNDPDGKAFDYRFLEINPGFEKHTGLQQALGKTIRQMVPNHDAHWFEIYGKVARTGKAIRFEKPATAMERYYDVYAYRIGGEGSQRVGILFNDISERNRAERLTEALFEISRAVYSTENVDELFRHIHRVLSSILQANNFSIALLTDDGKTLYFPYKSDEKDTNDRPAIGVDDPHSLTVDVLKTKSSVLLDETKLLDRYATDTSKVWGTAPKCWLGVPLMIRETVIGVMSVQDYQKSSAYSQKDLNIFESAAGQIAIAIERKRAQDALRESEHRTRTFLDSTSDMAFLKDDKFRHILANRALCKFHGKTEDEIKHKKDFDLMSEEAALRCRKTDEQTLLSNALTVNEELIGDRCFETVKFPVAIATGKVGIGGYIRDVTERRRAEEKIRLSEQHLKSYLDNAGDPIYVLEAATGRIRNCNVRACQDLGYSMDELLKLSASDIEVNLSSDKIDAIHHEAISAKVRTVEGAHKRKDGTMFPVEIRLSSMSPAQPELIIAVVRDVTERRRSEKALRMQSAALEAAANAIVITDCDGVVEWVNQAFVTLTGYTLEESVGRNPRELVKSGKHDQQFYKDLWDTILAGGTWRGQIINRRKNGSLYSEEQTITPLCDVDGKVSHFIAIKEDITERQRTEDLLAESERKFKWLFDYAPVAYHVLTPEGTIWNVNVRWCESLGYSKDEALGKSVFDFITESERSIARASFETKKKDISSIRTRNERRYVSKDGVVKTFLVGDFVTVDSQGKITSVQTTMEDITERKKIEHDLRLSEERFRSVWDNSADGMRLTNREGRIIDANASFCKLVRIPREELLGNVLSAAYQREGPDDDLRLYHQRFDASETISNLFGSATLRDGESIDLDISSSFIESAGQEKLLLSLFRDVTEKRKSEKRLEDERNLLRTIIDAIPDEIAVKDTERRFIVVNSGTVKAFIRNSADEIIGMKDEDLIPEHLVKDWSEEENTVLAGGKSSMNRVANKIDSETGAIERSLMVSKVPLKDREGKIIGLVGINRDITALKQAEEMLEKERTLLLTLIENIPDEVCLKDLRHRYLTANRAAMKALGVKSLEALIGKTDQDFAPQGLAQEHVEEEEAILESGKPLINRERIKIDPKTGQVVKCLLTTKVPVKDNTGAAIGILVVNRHITERKQMEELLRASEQKFRALFEESKDLVYFSTVGGKLLDINPAGIELLGYASKQETLSIDMANEGYADSEDKGRFDRQMAQHGFVKDYEVVLRRKDGERITVLETATAVMNNKGNVVQYRGVMRDVTKQRQLERQFLQAQKMDSIGTLAGGIAHDFNNILGIILGHLALLERTRENTVQFEESVFSINKAVERGASLVRQILTFARKTEAALEPVNINSAAKELAKMIEETFPKMITVTLRLDKTIPVVSMDPTQLHQALLNLCVNARDAMNGKGTLIIATHLALGRDVSSRFPKAGSSHYVQVSVSDTGTGMDEATRLRIFEPFFTTKEKGKGTGLGLAVVYGVIQAHNGFIDVESTPGAGTKFHLFFPVAEGIILKTAEAADKNQDLPGGTETILVVEDEDVLRDLLTKLLELHGYTVIAASDGVEAVNRFSEHENQIDLLLSDMGLPKRNGWDAFKLMQKTKPGVRALMASGYIEPGQKSEILKSGVRRFISKPYRMEEVLKAIRETLDEKE